MKLKLVASGFLNSMRNFFSGKSEGEADQSVDGQETLKPPVEFTPSALLEGVKDFYQAKPFMATRSERIANEEYHYREEHEPYRLEPDGDKIVCISTAFLYELHPQTAEVKRHPLTPLHIKVNRNCVVYATFKTDDHGRVKAEDGVDAYTLTVSEDDVVDLPDPTHFELPDGEGGAGVDGEYNVAICYIKNYNFLKLQVSEPTREAKLAGGLEGQRGPMWWVSGYDALRNIGGGNGKIYKDYKRNADFKDLRTLAEKGLDRNCSGDKNISGVPQIKVTQAADTIEIGGNGFSTSWKVGDMKMAIVEDGLVRCLEDLQVQELEQVEVITAQTASTTNVSVAACPAPAAQKGTAWSGGTTNDKMIQGTPRTNMWADGISNTLPWVQICISSTTSGGADTCYWVIGQEDSDGTAPTNVTVIDGATTVVGVDTVVQVKGLANNDGDGVDYAPTLDQVDIIKDLTCVTVAASSATSTSTAWVLRSGGTNVKVVKESTGDMCDDCPEE